MSYGPVLCSMALSCAPWPCPMSHGPFLCPMAHLQQTYNWPSKKGQAKRPRRQAKDIAFAFSGLAKDLYPVDLPRTRAWLWVMALAPPGPVKGTATSGVQSEPPTLTALIPVGLPAAIMDKSTGKIDRKHPQNHGRRLRQQLWGALRATQIWFGGVFDRCCLCFCPL